MKMAEKDNKVKNVAPLLPTLHKTVSRKPSIIMPLIVITVAPIAMIFLVRSSSAIVFSRRFLASKNTLAKKVYLPERPWQGETPRWCADLMRNPRERLRVPGLYDCKRDRFGALCHDGTPRFFSQYNQDIWTWKNHWQYLRRRGVYVDIAANEPVRISNTYFFDKCLNWRGLCVEANEKYRELLVQTRSCGIMPTCVSNKEENVTFVLDSGLSGVFSTNKNWRSKEVRPSTLLTCVPTADALDAAGMHRIDMLSLDVEGHEYSVLEGVDWKKTRINVIVIESVTKETRKLLQGLGYRLAIVPQTRKEKQMEGNLISDSVFLHPDVIWGKPV